MRNNIRLGIRMALSYSYLMMIIIILTGDSVVKNHYKFCVN
jgi:hypothetical protein